MLRRALGTLADSTTAAARALREPLADEAPTIRLRAAVAILAAARDLEEHDGLVARVERIEAMLPASR